MEHDLRDRFGHVNPMTGKPFIRNTFYRLLTQSPMTWGVISRHHSHRVVGQSPKKPYVLHWLYDPNVSVPVEIEIRRDACPAVFEGKDLEDMKAEMCRRSGIRGSMSPSQTHRFSGICMCNTCHMSTKIKSNYANKERTRKNYYVVCNSIYRNCPDRKSIRFDVIQSYIEALLLDIINAHAWPDGLAEEDTATQRLRRLETLSDRLDVIRREQENLRQAHQSQVRRQQVIEDSITYLEKVTLPGLWKLPEREINQFLKRLFDGRRIVIGD